jgi:IS30 family transposase
MARKYKRLRYEDRQTIETMLKSGEDIVEIAKAIGVHRDTIYKEITRSGADQNTYTADMAQMKI